MASGNYIPVPCPDRWSNANGDTDDFPMYIIIQADVGDVFGLSALANTHASIVEHLISYADWFFPGEVSYFDFYFSQCTRKS